ncbi:MAG: eCIS core domain-containing protein [Methylobacter sp.]
MNKTSTAHQAKTLSFLPPAQNLLQRKCACGNHTVAGGECAECAKKKSGLQRKLAIGASNDPLEQEADRVADQVMAAPVHSAVSGAPPHIQRYARQTIDGLDAAPVSVDHVLDSSGRPLEPVLRHDMEQRFGQDFSRVRVHSGTTAEQSAWDVEAQAYTAGHNIVFGAGRFAPGTREGRRLLAHELTHVVQQSGAEANVVRRSDGFEDEPTGQWEQAHTRPGGGWRGSIERSGGGGELTEEVTGEMVEEELTLEEALAELEAEAALAAVGEILLILGPVLVLFVGFFGSIAEALARLREEAYLLGFSEGMAANLLGMGAPWVNERLIARMPANYPEVSVGGFKAARVGGNNQGVVDGYRFVQRFTYKQRGAFLKHGFEKVVATRGPFAMNPKNFGLDDVIALGIALQPTVVKLLEIARQQELAREKARMEKLLGPRGRGWAAS